MENIASRACIVFGARVIGNLVRKLSLVGLSIRDLIYKLNLSVAKMTSTSCKYLDPKPKYVVL